MEHTHLEHTDDQKHISDKERLVQSHIHVSVKHFDGPLDILLLLVQKNKIDIYDIPIAEITEQYLVFLRELVEKDLENLTEFYKMATLLLYIKSRMLLPLQHVDDLEEMEDPRTELVDKLIEYQKFKKLSGLLQKQLYESPPLLLRKEPDILPLTAPTELEWKEMTPLSLLQSFLKIVDSNKEVERIIDLHEEVTIKQKITVIYELMEKHKQFTFSDIVGTKSILSLVCSLLAVLELLKQQVIRAIQKQSYGVIYLQKRETVLP